MVADTENKRPRGRPRKISDMAVEVMGADCTRTAQNQTYAAHAVKVLEDPKPGRDGYYHCFLLSERGNFRRQGISEQLGRMLNDGLITIEDGKELLQTCKEEYKSGDSVKQIEKRLRRFRLEILEGLKD